MLKFKMDLERQYVKLYTASGENRVEIYNTIALTSSNCPHLTLITFVSAASYKNGKHNIHMYSIFNYSFQWRAPSSLKKKG